MDRRGFFGTLTSWVTSFFVSKKPNKPELTPKQAIAAIKSYRQLVRKQMAEIEDDFWSGKYNGGGGIP